MTVVSNPESPLLVRLENVDIEIGAVEVKDGSTDNRLEVNSSGSASVSLKTIGNATVSVSQGTSGSGTQRVILANDDPAVTLLASIDVSTSAMDDWDESDRAKVNPIVGQAGVQGGSGAVSATTQRVVQATDVNVPSQITDTTIDDYETVAASQTAQVLGPTGATGDYISHVLVIPATLSPGNVLLLDNATSITIFTGGTDSVGSLQPFPIPLGMKSVSGAWKLTTGANVSCIGIGKFT